MVLFCCMATNLSDFLSSIASISKTKPVTSNFSNNLFITHRRRNRENHKKVCGSRFCLNIKNRNFKVGGIPFHNFFTQFFFTIFYNFCWIIFCIKKVVLEILALWKRNFWHLFPAQIKITTLQDPPLCLCEGGLPIS